MLVSHDKELRRQVHAWLSSVGIATSVLTTVRNRDECLVALTKRRPRLVVVDDSSRELDGLGLLHVLHQRVPEALVVYLTTHHTLELERAVRQLGVLYYTEKPPDPFAFEQVLATVFASATKASTESATPWKGS
jgi:DNA-binding NtrC family response regulator